MIIAVDFDGTLCEEKWPGIGRPHGELIEALIDERKNGVKLILWTCREGSLLEEAVEWCKAHGLEFDAVNENPQDEIIRWGKNPRKVAADYYIDDRSYSPLNYWAEWIRRRSRK